MPSISVPVAAAAVGAVGSVAGGLISSSGAKSAANTQAQAADAASQRALQQYQQTRADLGPYRVLGNAAIDRLGAIFQLPGYGGIPATAAPTASPAESLPTDVFGGVQGTPAPSTGALPNGWQFVPANALSGTDNATGGVVFDANGNVMASVPDSVTNDAQAAAFLKNQGTLPSSGSAAPAAAPSGPVANPLASYGISGLTFQPTQAQLEATPGYKFDLSQGLQSVQNANAARGLGISGAALKGAANYATGLANNTLTTQQGIFQSNLQNVLGPLQNFANLGQTAATQTGQQGIQAIGNANALQVGGANAQAAGTVGSANALGGALSNVAGAPLNYLLYNNLLGGGGGSGFTDSTSTFA